MLKKNLLQYLKRFTNKQQELGKILYFSNMTASANDKNQKVVPILVSYFNKIPGDYEADSMRKSLRIVEKPVLTSWSSSTNAIVYLCTFCYMKKNNPYFYLYMVIQIFLLSPEYIPNWSSELLSSYLILLIQSLYLSYCI